MQEIKNELENKIKNLIDSGEVKIKPKWHFVLKGIVILLGFLVVMLSCILFLSVILFKERVLPPHKTYELITNMQVLPFIILALLFIIFAIFIALHADYNMVYKRPALILVIVIVAVVGIISVILDRYTVHDRVFRNIDPSFTPYMRKMYLMDETLHESGVHGMQKNIEIRTEVFQKMAH